MIHLIIFVVKIVIAALLGGILGYGVRQTNSDGTLQAIMLVLVGTTVFSGLYPRTGGNTETVVFGVLLAGIIIGISIFAVSALLQNKESDSGFLVAGSVWSAAAVGVLTGTGQIIKALLLTGLLYYILHYIPGVLHPTDESDTHHTDES